MRDENGASGSENSSSADVADKRGNLCDSSGVMLTAANKPPNFARLSGKNLSRASTESLRSSKDDFQ